jgi:S1-C subfamily serine protease
MNRLASILSMILLLSLPVFGQSGSDATSADYQKIYKKVDRVLVSVQYKAEMTFMGQSDDIEGRVAGLSVEPAGTIIFDGTTLSGAHFGAEAYGAPRVEKPKSIKVTDYKGNTYEAEFIGVDQFSSIAFCRLPDSVKNAIESAHFDTQELSLGQQILVFWMLPDGFEPRFQMSGSRITNILTKPEEYYLTGELTTDFIMTPVVTTSGKFVGVITPISRIGSRSAPFDAGESFGVPVGLMPIDRFNELLSKPPAPDEFKRGWLGIALQALDPEIAAFWHIKVPGGIIVSEVIPNSPAEKAGLKQGDFIIGLDSAPIDIKDDADLTVFRKDISDLGAGGVMNMMVVRPGDSLVDTLEITAVLDQAPTSASDAPSFEENNFDMTVRDMVFADYNARSLKPEEISGVIIDKEESGGWAAVDGLRPGDIIMKINDHKVASVEDCKPIFAGIEKDKKREVVFMIWRYNKTQFVNIKTHWE